MSWILKDGGHYLRSVLPTGDDELTERQCKAYKFGYREAAIRVRDADCRRDRGLKLVRLPGLSSIDVARNGVIVAALQLAERIRDSDFRSAAHLDLITAVDMLDIEVHLLRALEYPGLGRSSSEERKP